MYPRASLVLVLVCLLPNINSHDCSDDQVNPLELKHIKIDNYNGSFTKEMMKLLHNVEILEITQSHLTPWHQSSLNALKNLRKFKIAHCHIVRAEGDISDCCKELRELEFINSGFPSMMWPNYAKLSLDKFYILREKIPKLDADILKGSPVKHLTIERSDIETIDDGAFNGLDHLETLNLEHNKIKKITKELLTPMKSLKHLNLEGNLLQKLTTDLFPSLPHLEEINIGHNPITEINLEGIKEKAPKLSKLDISGIEGVDTSKVGGVSLVSTDVL